MKSPLIFPGRRDDPVCAAFTLPELLVVIVVLVALALVVLPALARTQPDSRTFQCLNNLSQMGRAWRMYADDYNDVLLASLDVNDGLKRVIWCTGALDFSGNASNWDVNQNLAKSPIQPYVGKNVYTSWRCPADLSAVTVGGKRLPRVRSISMSQAFDYGAWLPSPTYRVFAKGTDIVNPAKTWVFTEEHPDGINDGAFALQMAPSGSTSAQIIDFPASYHDGGCNMVFADGHSAIHKWIGSRIRPPVTYTTSLALNVSAGNSVSDVIWFSSVTTVRN